MKPRRKQTRPEKSPRRPRTVSAGRSDLLRQQLLEKIIAWAEYHKECTLAGCRRNDRCLKPDKCRVVSDEPWTKQDKAEVRGRIETFEAIGGEPE